MISNLVAPCQKLSQAKTGFTVDGVLTNKWLPEDHKRSDGQPDPKEKKTDAWLPPPGEKAPAKPVVRGLDFDRPVAIERNRTYLNVLNLMPETAAAEITKTLAACVAIYPAEHRVRILYEQHKDGETLESVAVLVALWQFVFTKGAVDGWTTRLEGPMGERYKKSVGGEDALTSEEERARLKKVIAPRKR